MNIEQDDVIARCIIFDKCFQSGIHVDAVLFGFPAKGQDGASHESGVLRRLAPHERDVHRIGCRIAKVQNERRNSPPPGPKRRYYCGFREAIYSDLSTSGEGYDVRIEVKEEGGEPAHVDFALVVSVEGKNERANAKVEAGLALAEAFGPAVRHVCPEDENDDHHPLHRDPLCLERRFPSSAPILTSPRDPSKL